MQNGSFQSILFANCFQMRCACSYNILTKIVQNDAIGSTDALCTHRTAHGPIVYVIASESITFYGNLMPSRRQVFFFDFFGIVFLRRHQIVKWLSRLPYYFQSNLLK